MAAATPLSESWGKGPVSVKICTSWTRGRKRHSMTGAFTLVGSCDVTVGIQQHRSASGLLETFEWFVTWKHAYGREDGSVTGRSPVPMISSYQTLEENPNEQASREAGRGTRQRQTREAVMENYLTAASASRSNRSKRVRSWQLARSASPI